MKINVLFFSEMGGPNFLTFFITIKRAGYRRFMTNARKMYVDVMVK